MLLFQVENVRMFLGKVFMMEFLVVVVAVIVLLLYSILNASLCVLLLQFGDKILVN